MADGTGRRAVAAAGPPSGRRAGLGTSRAAAPVPAACRHGACPATRAATSYGPGTHGPGGPAPASGRELSAASAPCCMVRVHVVVVGCGRVGSGLAVGLGPAGPHAWPSWTAGQGLPTAPGRLGRAATVVGSGFDRDDLERAGADGADALAAVTSGDNTNILTARIARENYGIPNVVARIYDPRRAEIYQRLGHPHRGHRHLDHRPGPPPAPARDWSPASGPTPPASSSWSSGRCPSAGPARRLADVEDDGRVSLVGGHPGRGAPPRRPPSWWARRATCSTWPSSSRRPGRPRGAAEPVGLDRGHASGAPR